MDPKTEILQLRREIAEHDRRYYEEAAPSITDREYDALYARLAELEQAHPQFASEDSPTRRVGGKPLDAFTQVRHRTPMMSLDNTYSESQITDFFCRLQRSLGIDEIPCVVEPKVDGVAISLLYEKGTLRYAATRGDGTTGDDVTQNILTIPSVPRHLPTGAPEILEVRGEVYMTKTGFRRLNEERAAEGLPPFANPRNSAAGSLKQLDPAEVRKRPLGLLLHGFGLIEGADLHTHSEAMALLDRLGLPRSLTIWHAGTAQEILQAIRALDEIRRNFPYETDGAVVKLESFALREQLGNTAKAPRWAVAFKYEPERAETRLLGISIQVGRTGVLTPVAELEPVFLAGSTIARATLHNEDEIRRKDLRIGDTVVIEKAGEVIPAVIRVVPEYRPPDAVPFDLTEHIGGRCPACGGPVERDPEFVAWRCQNLDCPAQKVRRLEFFVARKALDVEAIGSIVAEKLVETGLVDDPLDLFSIPESTFAALNLGTTEEPRVFGPKNAAKTVTALQRAKTLPLARWIHALGIPEIGEATAILLAKHHRTLHELAHSRLLTLTASLPVLEERRKATSPRSPAWRHADLQARADLERRHAETLAEIEAAGAELGAAGFAKRGKSLTTAVGPVAAASVLRWFTSPRGVATLARLEALGIQPLGDDPKSAIPQDSPFVNKTFVITGTLASMDRDEAHARIRALGGKPTSSVSKHTDFVIVGTDAGSKAEKARGLGVSVLDEPAFLAMLSDATQPPTPETSP